MSRPEVDPEGDTDRWPVVREDNKTEDSTPAPVPLLLRVWSQAALMARAALGARP